MIKTWNRHIKSTFLNPIGKKIKFFPKIFSVFEVEPGCNRRRMCSLKIVSYYFDGQKNKKLFLK